MSGKKRWCIFGGVILLVFLIPYLFLIVPAQKKIKFCRAGIENKTVSLRSFLIRPGGPPGEKTVGILTGEIKILEEKYKDIEKAFIPASAKPLDISPVEFGNILHETKRKLAQEAQNASVEVPDNLGFKETIPASEEVISMTKELEAVTAVVREAIASRVDIKEIRYHGVKAEELWEKAGIELDLYGRFENITGFLYSVSRKEKIYIIKELEIKGTADGKSPAPAGSRAKKGNAELPGQRAVTAKQKSRPDISKPGLLAETNVSVTVYLESCNYIARHGD